MEDTRIAAVVCNAPVGRVRENLEALARWTAEAARCGARIVCFPELNLSGYTTRESLHGVAEPVPGPAADEVAGVARTYGVVVLAGLVEQDPDGRLFVSHLVATPEGLAGVYRKLHVSPPEAPLFAPGEAVPLFRAGGVRFGIQLCYDAHFPELSTRMAVQGAEVIFIPHASPRTSARQKADSWMRHLPARAFDNAVFVVACNQVGDNRAGLRFPGVAMALGPDGLLIGRRVGGGEGLLVVDLAAGALEAVRSHPMRYFLPGRRPELYGF